MMTKPKYRSSVLSLLAKFMARHGYTPDGRNQDFVKEQSGDVTTSLTTRVVTAKLPRSVVQLDLDVAIRSDSVAAVCSRLVGRSAELATIWGPLGRFLSRNDYLSSYRFDWNVDLDQQFDRLTRDLESFFRFSESVRDYRDLDIERLIKIPLLRRNFADGLGENYRYSLPEISAVLHAMTGRPDRARQALDIARTDQSGRLDSGHIAALEDFLAAQN